MRIYEKEKLLMNLIYGYDRVAFDDRFDDYCDGFDEYEEDLDWSEDMVELFRERIAELFD